MNKETKFIDQFKKIEVIGALAMLIAFFLPWINVLMFGDVGAKEAFLYSVFSEQKIVFSGFGIATISQLTETIGWQTRCLWVLPFAVVLLIISAIISGGEFYTRRLAFIAGSLPFLLLLYTGYAINQNVLKFLSVGAWATLLIGILLMLYAMGAIRQPNFLR